jgi:methionyl-tRNA formyltransferase
MRLIFMGSPEIAVPSLQALAAAGHEIVCVVTQPDKPQGRGQRLSPPAVKAAAQEMGLTVLQPAGLKAPELMEQLRSHRADGMVVVAYGKLLPKAVIEMTRLGCVNVHFSLLPKYRGAACVAYALMNGDDETGVSTMLIDEGLDTGPILMQWTEPIQEDDTAETVSQRLAELGAQQIVHTLAGLERGDLEPVPQREAEASYAPLLKKEQGHVDWSRPAREIYNLYRGLTPWPGIYSFLEGRRLLWVEVRPEAGESQGEPGRLGVGPGGEMRIQCGSGRLQILKLKPEGKRILSAEEFMRGLQGKHEWVLK